MTDDSARRLTFRLTNILSRCPKPRSSSQQLRLPPWATKDNQAQHRRAKIKIRTSYAPTTATPKRVPPTAVVEGLAHTSSGREEERKKRGGSNIRTRQATNTKQVNKKKKKPHGSEFWQDAPPRGKAPQRTLEINVNEKNNNQMHTSSPLQQRSIRSIGSIRSSALWPVEEAKGWAGGGAGRHRRATAAVCHSLRCTQQQIICQSSAKHLLLERVLT